MPIVAFACLMLVVLTTLLHYETFRLLSLWLPRVQMPSRPKLLVVMAAAFVAHALEIFMYGVVLYVLVAFVSEGVLKGTVAFTFMNCLYFSAETYTSLGFGEIVPVGPVRLLVGVEALNGLLLIGWTASFTYIEMARFWRPEG